MARPWSRKGRKHRPGDKAPRAGDDVGLDAAEHAWWAQRDAAQLLSESTRSEPDGQPAREHKPERDILAEHFGADWRTSFGFDHSDDVREYQPPEYQPPVQDVPPEDEPPAPDRPEIDTSDPYDVLQVDPGATWEEIVKAHRSQARHHHPDRLAGQPEATIAAAEERIRDINAAYQELRVRRGK